MKTLSFRVLVAILLATGSAFAATPQPELQEIKIVDDGSFTFSEGLLLHHPNGGQARVLISVSSEGKLLEWLVVAYTARSFAEEAGHAVKSWRYLPARWRGDPIAATSEITVTFESKGALITTRNPMESLEVFTRFGGGPGYAYRPYGGRELHTPPGVLEAPSPRYAPSLAERGVAGEVTVDFYIDEAGAVRIPSIVNQQHPDLASAAIAAIRQWKFSPGLVAGKPVLVHARQTFRFNPPLALAR
jgi:TonB family protein